MGSRAKESDLALSLNSDGSIGITRGPEVSELDWKRVQAVFGRVGSDREAPEQISCDAVFFEWKAVWLKSWERDKKTISWDSQVPKVLGKIRSSGAAFHQILEADPSRHARQVVNVPDLLKSLTTEQNENVLCLLDMPNGCNFSVPGAGKTLTTLATWKILRGLGTVARLLVVCPRSAMDSWQEEVAESFSTSHAVQIFTGDPIDPRTEICLVNYEQLENPEKLARISRWLSAEPSNLVIDEAHRIKGGGRSVRWRACADLSKVAQRVDVLTGTPMPNGPDDLKSLFAVTWPRLQEGAISPRDYPKLRRKTVFVRTTKDELDLPPVEIRTILGKPTKLHQNILDALRDTYSGTFGLSVRQGQYLANRGKAVMTLLAAATNPGLLVSRNFGETEFGFSWPPAEISDDRDLSALIKEYLNFDMPWKYRQVIDIVGQLDAAGEKTIVWSSFVGNLAAMKRYLNKFSPAVIYGGTSADDRQRELQRFRNDPQCTVLLTNPQTLGEGISLHMVCNNAIYIDRTFNAGHYLQSVDRIHRLGLPKDRDTTIYLLQTEGSVDQRASIRLEQKIRSLSDFLKDPSLAQTAIPTGEEVPADEALGLTEDDFTAITAFINQR